VIDFWDTKLGLSIIRSNISQVSLSKMLLLFDVDSDMYGKVS
jgi:hypothetical protein